MVKHPKDLELLCREGHLAEDAVRKGFSVSVPTEYYSTPERLAALYGIDEDEVRAFVDKSKSKKARAGRWLADALQPLAACAIAEQMVAAGVVDPFTPTFSVCMKRRPCP
ncbi:hypothetical protein SO694_0053300 [Aureococcus anophagefferens]|uniref:Uncharacterized protein n=2 Tax=Aureococcus anophagefferens TaxID=44056 RepID=F0Y2Y0_AURAN|nr:hypothetical protein AURANDRAFT_62755 [Aureococcus anophagefferens]EGB10162.1 hypothetical protein AURANDRAFT_62755 [Aureococcus anophagefferens]KAH8090200.1 hypothetical protein JL720_6511 [Aureococcus anophagefferens]|eukprot:XP_009034986.1 hypothetical protein AURANDRAFT_62755 [Aureococcus anophagefferens]